VRTLQTTDRPSGLRNLLRAAAGALPFIPRSDELPDRTLKVEGLQIDVQDRIAVGDEIGNGVPTGLASSAGEHNALARHGF